MSCAVLGPGMKKRRYSGWDARPVGSLAVFTVLLILTGSPLLAQPGPMLDDSSPRAQAALAALRTAVASGRVVRAEVFAMPYEVLTPFAVAPDHLRSSPDKKYSIELNRKLADELIQAIDGVQLQPDKWGSDLRWGAVFLDRSGVPLHAIYLDSCYFGGAGRKGYIDGVRVQLNGSDLLVRRQFLERLTAMCGWPLDLLDLAGE